jgi:hypothetical protein
MHDPLQTQYDETNGNTEFLKPYPVVTADASFEISTAVISAVLSLDGQLLQTLPVSRNVTSRCTVLFGTYM